MLLEAHLEAIIVRSFVICGQITPGRNPSIGWNGVFNFVNNVIFNWVHRSIDGGDQTSKVQYYKQLF